MLIRRRHVLAAPLGLLGARASAQEQAAKIPVDMLLQLLVDVSDSVDTQRYQFQKRGYELAFRNKEVIHALTSKRHRRVAVMHAQWSGWGQFAVTAPWTLIDGEASAHAFADTIAQSKRVYSGATSIAGAICYGMINILRAQYHSTKRVMDISGDGIDVFPSFLETLHSKITGYPTPMLLTHVRQLAEEEHITINGLPIEGGPKEEWQTEDIVPYYRNHVILGPGSFAFGIADPENPELVEYTIRKKILTESVA